jgi:hypothetical protein
MSQYQRNWHDKNLTKVKNRDRAGSDLLISKNTLTYLSIIAAVSCSNK